LPTDRADMRTVCLIALTVLMGIGALVFARALFVPILVGILLSYMLEPLVAACVAIGASRTAAATIVFCATLIAVSATAYALRHQVSALIDELPTAAQQLRVAIESRSAGHAGPVTQVQRAADELRQLSTETPPPSVRGPVALDHQPFQLADYLWSSSLTLTGFLGDVIVVLFLALYLLLAGDLFRRRLIEIAGPTLSRKKITLQILDAISMQIGRFLFVRAVISLIVATSTGLAFWAIGLAQPAVWGVAAGALNIVPYVGPAFVMIAAALAAFLQFQTLTMAAVTAAIAVGIACVEAYVVTPWLTSRAADMNPAAVFVGLVFWGWVWGLPGLILAIPLLMVLRSIADHVEALQPLAVLLRK